MNSMNWKPILVFGLMTMFGIMIGAMIAITRVSSGSGAWWERMPGVMVFLFIGMLMMPLIMALFLRNMARGGRLMSRMMGHSYASPQQSMENNMTTLTYTVPAVNCGHCKMMIEREVGKLSGVAAVNVDVDSRKAVIKLVSPATEAEIETVLAEIGYPPASHQKEAAIHEFAS